MKLFRMIGCLLVMSMAKAVFARGPLFTTKELKRLNQDERLHFFDRYIQFLSLAALPVDLLGLNEKQRNIILNEHGRISALLNKIEQKDWYTLQAFVIHLKQHFKTQVKNGNNKSEKARFSSKTFLTHFTAENRSLDELVAEVFLVSVEDDAEKKAITFFSDLYKHFIHSLFLKSKSKKSNSLDSLWQQFLSLKGWSNCSIEKKPFCWFKTDRTSFPYAIFNQSQGNTRKINEQTPHELAAVVTHKRSTFFYLYKGILKDRFLERLKDKDSWGGVVHQFMNEFCLKQSMRLIEKRDLIHVSSKFYKNIFYEFGYLGPIQTQSELFFITAQDLNSILINEGQLAFEQKTPQDVICAKDNLQSESEEIALFVR